MKSYALQTRPHGHPFPIVAYLIMIFQKMLPWSKYAYSHNAILFTQANGYSWVIDSTSKGVRIQSDLQFLKKNRVVGLKSLPKPKSEAQFFSWAHRILGRGYDHSQIKGLALKTLGFVTLNKFGDNYKKMTCNEVLLNYLEFFSSLRFGDPDNYDLVLTWKAIPDNF